MKKSKTAKKRKPSGKKSLPDRLRAIFSQKSPVLKFAAVFGLGIILFYAIYFSDFFTDHIAGSIVAGQANVAGFLLNIFGFQAEVDHTLLTDGKVLLDIKKGCDGIEPTVFFLIGVLLVPFSRKAKLVGLVLGLVVLSILNILRIMGLFVASSLWPESFDFLHLHGGFTLFFITAMVLWVLWANWAIGLSPAVRK